MTSCRPAARHAALPACRMWHPGRRSFGLVTPRHVPVLALWPTRSEYRKLRRAASVLLREDRVEGGRRRVPEQGPDVGQGAGSPLKPAHGRVLPLNGDLALVADRVEGAEGVFEGDVPLPG